MTRFTSVLPSGGRPAALLAFLCLAAGAPAQALTCGQTITVRTTLTADLLNCPGNGLVIGAHRIVLNLNGKTIDGVGLGVGVLNNGFDNVTIRSSVAGGTIKEFDYGVQLNPGTLGNIVELLTITLNEFAGVQLSNADTNNRIRNNTITWQNHVGIALLNDSRSNVVHNNTLDRNSGTATVLVDNSHSNTIQDNQLLNGSNTGALFTASRSNIFLRNTVSNMGDGGLWLMAASNFNDVESNTFSGSGDAGVTVTDSTNNFIELNTTPSAGDAGLKLTNAHSNQVLSNTFRSTSDCGIELQDSNNNTVRSNDVRFGPCGISLDHSNGNRLELNNASNTNALGIAMRDSIDCVVIRNTANTNLADGIYVSGEAGPGDASLIDRNTTSFNKGNGIVVASTVHTISNNTARTNDGWGIYAVAGNTDGGGNKASGNAEAAQCFGVVCTP